MDWLWDDEVWPAITQSAKRACGGARASVVATAYLGKNAGTILPLKSGDRLLVDASDASVRAGATSVSAIDAYVSKGVVVRSRSGLHSKAYVLGGTAFVGSANLSASGLIECMVRVTEPAVVRDIRQRLLAEHEATVHLTDERLKMLRSLPVRRRLAPTRTDNDRIDQGLTQVTRIRVAEVEEVAMSTAAVSVWERTRQSARRRVGPRSLWELDPLTHDWSLIRRLRKDGTEAVIEVVDSTAHAPARVVETYKVGRSRGLAHLARPVGAAPLPWGDLRSRYAKSTGRVLRLNSVVTSPVGIQAILRCFSLIT